MHWDDFQGFNKFLLLKEIVTVQQPNFPFITILDEIAKIEDIVNRNEDLVSIIAVLQDVTQKMLGFRCES